MTTRFDEMKRAVSAAYEWSETFADIEAIEDPHERLRLYQIIANDRQPEQQACDFRIRCGKRGKTLARKLAAARKLLGIEEADRVQGNQAVREKSGVE